MGVSQRRFDVLRATHQQKHRVRIFGRTPHGGRHRDRKALVAAHAIDRDPDGHFISRLRVVDAREV